MCLERRCDTDELSVWQSVLYLDINLGWDLHLTKNNSITEPVLFTLHMVKFS
jgi:hypothetical protein